MSASLHALEREVAVRVQLDADHAACAHDGPHAADDVALHVGVAVGDHGAVQAEQDAVERHRGPALVEDLVAHGFVVAAVGGAGGAGGEAAALDQFEPVPRGPAPGHE